MHLDTEEFTEMVQRDNGVSSILKKCVDMINLDGKGNTDAGAIGMVTLDQQYSKGSVDAARGKTPQLMEKKLEYRNTVVRDVKRGLTMKRIDVSDLSNDESSVISDCDEDNVSAPFRPKITRRAAIQRSTGYGQLDCGQDSKPGVAGKFQAAAKVSKLMGGLKRDTERSI